MSTIESEDLEATGYFLPEESQSRLKKLRGYVEFLSYLAQPRTVNPEQEWVPEIRAGEVVTCLELLAEQLGLVLDGMSWPALRHGKDGVPGADAEPEAAEQGPDGAGGRYVFGVTLEQVDRLDQLIGMISAHGDVVAASDDAELVDQTLPLLGHAIFGDARAVRQIIRQVTSQKLRRARGSQTGVGEERAVYMPGDAGQACLPVDDAPHSRGGCPHAGDMAAPFSVPPSGRSKCSTHDGQASRGRQAPLRRSLERRPVATPAPGAVTHGPGCLPASGATPCPPLSCRRFQRRSALLHATHGASLTTCEPPPSGEGADFPGRCRSRKVSFVVSMSGRTGPCGSRGDERRTPEPRTEPRKRLHGRAQPCV